MFSYIVNKGTVFYFFPEIVYTALTHPIWVNFVFYFFHFLEKKIQTVFFLFPGKVSKPLTRKKSDIYKKRSQKGTLCCFSELFKFWRYNFCFRTILCFLFFPRKSLQSTHSLKFRSREKKIQHWKKYNIFTHSLDFWLKMAKVKLFPGNKKIRYLLSRRVALFLLRKLSEWN